MIENSLVGQTLGKYKVTEHLGRGGMAEVYKGYREDLDRTVAIKLMHSFLVAEQDFLFRFKREARAMAKMRHPNIVSVYDFDVYGENTYYLVMEYIGGGTLKEKLTDLAERGERLPLTESIRIALEVANALTYAHQRDMVHRDIKPANIMLDEFGKAVLTDFGIVKLVGGQSMAYTATGALIGTPAYMSPEQALGKPGDGRSDLYSLGVLLFQMVAGQLPFAADTPLAVVMKHVNEPVPLPIAFNPDVPLGLQEIIVKAMAKDPDERFQSAAEMATALRQADMSILPDAAAVEAATILAKTPAVHDTPTAQRTSVAATAVATPEDRGSTAGVTPPAAAAPGKRRSPWLFVGGALLLLVLTAVALFMSGLLPGRQPTPTATQSVAAVVPPTETLPPPTDTPDVVASSVAAIAQTAQALATDTATSTSTATPTAMSTSTPTSTATSTPSPTATSTQLPSATPNVTATFLAGCTKSVELVASYTYRDNINSAPVNTNFPVNWVLRNDGTCSWPTDLQWTFLEGAELGYDGASVPVGTEVAPQEEITLKTTLTSPAAARTYESTWQLVNTAGEPYGSPLTFVIRTYVPATATPVPVATPVPQSTPTTEVKELAWSRDIRGCEYRGTEWRCQMIIVPYGGGGGPYTVWVFDADQPAEYRGPGPFTHFVGARRCSAYIHEVKIQDDATGTSFSDNVYIDPNSYFAGGCTEP
jgi:serine/threonine protein kinase